MPAVPCKVNSSYPESSIHKTLVERRNTYEMSVHVAVARLKIANPFDDIQKSIIVTDVKGVAGRYFLTGDSLGIRRFSGSSFRRLKTPSS